MVALCAAVFVAALDQTMVLTVMPDIMRSLYIDVRNLNDAGWIITAYLLGLHGGHAAVRPAGRRRGRRLMTMVALGLFLIGSALCVFLARLDLFVVARVIQAAGGGALVPIAMAAAADMYPAVPTRAGAGHHRRSGGGRGSPRSHVRGRRYRWPGAGGSSSW